MEKNKAITISIRTNHTIKELLRLCAKRHHRSLSSMVEYLILSESEKYVLGEDALRLIDDDAKRDQQALEG